MGDSEESCEGSGELLGIERVELVPSLAGLASEFLSFPGRAGLSHAAASRLEHCRSFPSLP